jgi:autotransporter strand-loop-strand O-heptosyltransferase
MNLHYIAFESSSLGDTIAWFPFITDYQIKNNCKIIVSTFWNELFEAKYPQYIFIKPGEIAKNISKQVNLGCFREDGVENWRRKKLQDIASDILGVERGEKRPEIDIKEKKNPFDRKTVCIATRSTLKMKLWNHPYGWQQVTSFLRNSGFDVACIDQDSRISLPFGAKNMTGDEPIQKRVTEIYNCDLFVGLSSGLTWLAWALNKRTVMISGFTSPKHEFFSENRVFNKESCNSCWHDPSPEMDFSSFSSCPREKDFECSTSITPEMVISELRKVIKV